MEEFIFSVSGYSGFEDEILKLRNTNRSFAQSREYLDWRYAKSSDTPDPVVFWIKSVSGESVGMASLIYRPYWMNSKPVYLGVIGDIALDASLRGKGLGRRLMLYIKEHLEQNLPEQAAFVIPNEAAQKSLISAKWETGEKLIPYVLILNPREKLTGLLKNGFLAKLVSLSIRTLILFAAGLHVKRGTEIQFVDRLDDSFDVLWKTISKEGMILGDRGIDSLTWRYIDHPNKKFGMAKFLKGTELAGYLIYEYSPSEGTCLIYDLVVKDKGDILRMLALFLLNSDKLGYPDSYRLTINDGHQFNGKLWRLGFIRRESQATFYVHRSSGFLGSSPLNWFISIGDKDI